MKRFIKILFLWVLLWFCGDVCGRWLVYMKIETSCNGFMGMCITGWWFQIFHVHPYLGKLSNLTNIFQVG